MTIPIQMPKLPGGADHGTVRRWFKAQGERVSQGDLLVLIDTEKAQVELESASAGRLEKILAEVGHTLRPGSDLAILTEGEAPIPQQEKPTMVKKDSKKRDETPTSLATGDVQAILMPKAGNDMEEGTLLSWKVKEGDSVKPGDVLFEIETDKATLEIESEYQGTIRRIVVQEEEMVPIHTPLAYIADSDAALDAWLAQQGSAPAEAKAEEAKPEAKAPVAAAA
ncbi:biotin/lipoyl-binding protein, partial [bacterium]|nr:biotin/lipoyl-binding protein [bacterium]